MNPDVPYYYGHRKRLRERFLKAGFAGMAEHEIVEVLLTLAIPRKDVKKPAKDLLARFGSLRAILDASFEDLRKVHGIGTVAPVALRIIHEAANLYLQQKAEVGTCLASLKAMCEFWRARLGGLRIEAFEVAYLDSHYRLLRDGVERLEEGTIDRAVVYPRKVMEAALRKSAAALVFAHNHPSGDVSPSEHDKVLTRALVLAASTLQIKVVDHLIVSKEHVFSFHKAGLL
ncbi:MAG: DNA repair protein RadC [Nitrospiraceae bacterium]|nr:DNA repair protein RadC [Nitrospiraceae bacterium]